MKSISEIKHLCTGCGVCAGICNSIQMEVNDLGLYKAHVKGNCTNCGRCVSICSQIDQQKSVDTGFFNASGLQYKPETGFYLACYDGYVEQNRWECASGGMCSELLVTILKLGKVNAIYCAVSNPDSDKLFVCQRLTTEEEIRKNTRSAYYPIEISQAVESIRSNNEKVAVVCLPCQAKALRLAMKNDLNLKEKIRYIVGLVCGGLPGKAMVEYLAEANGAHIGDIYRLTFREKDKDIKCNNCQAKLYDINDKIKVISRYHGDYFGFAYFNRLFHNDACWTCDDVFAEYADVVFGDAWYKENTQDILGTSICLTRNIEIDEIIQTMGDSIQSVDVSKLIEAQKNVSVIDKKKRLSAEYAKVYHLFGYSNSNRITNHLGVKERIKCWLTLFCYCCDRILWRKYKRGRINFTRLDSSYHWSVELRKRLHL